MPSGAHEPASTESSGRLRPVVVLCDNDGCLSPETHEPMDPWGLAAVAEHNRHAIAALDRGIPAGPVVTVCSGRPAPFVEAMCRLINNSRYPAIAENGVWLWDPASNHFHIDPAILPHHFDAVRSLQQWAQRELVPRGVTIQPGKAASVSLHPAEGHEVGSLVDRMTELVVREGWPVRVSRTVRYVNCDLSHVSKASGIARFIAHTGLDRSLLGGIGDTTSDLAIRQRVALFGCPANADEALKPSADVISEQPQVRGVLEILRRWSPADADPVRHGPRADHQHAQGRALA